MSSSEKASWPSKCECIVSRKLSTISVLMRFSHPFFSKMSFPSFYRLFRICIFGSRSVGFSAFLRPRLHSWTVAAVCCELCTLSSFLGSWMALLSRVKGWFLSSALDNFRYFCAATGFLVKNISSGTSSLSGVGGIWSARAKKGLECGVREEKLEKCSCEICFIRRLAGRLSLTSLADLFSALVSHETQLLGEMMDLEVESTSHLAKVGTTSLVWERSRLSVGLRRVVGESKDLLSFSLSSLRSRRSSRSCAMNLGIFFSDSCPNPHSWIISMFCSCFVVRFGESSGSVSLCGKTRRLTLLKLSMSCMVSTSRLLRWAWAKKSREREERMHLCSKRARIWALRSSWVLALVEAGWLRVGSSFSHTRHLLALLMKTIRSETSKGPKRSKRRSKPTRASLSRQSTWKRGSLGREWREEGKCSTARWRAGGRAGGRRGSS